MNVRALDPADLAWAEAFLDEEMGGRRQARLGELIDVLALPGLVAEDNGERVGLLTYRRADDECEIAVIAAASRHRGVGTALIESLCDLVDEPVWLVTTNDNLDALRFYQRRGFPSARLACRRRRDRTTAEASDRPRSGSTTFPRRGRIGALAQATALRNAGRSPPPWTTRFAPLT